MEKDYWITKLWNLIKHFKKDDYNRTLFLRIFKAGRDSYLYWKFDDLGILTDNYKFDGMGLLVQTITATGYAEQAILTDYEIREENSDLVDVRFAVQEFRKFMAKNFKGYIEDCVEHIKEVEYRKADKRIERECKMIDSLTTNKEDYIKLIKEKEYCKADNRIARNCKIFDGLTINKDVML